MAGVGGHVRPWLKAWVGAWGAVAGDWLSHLNANRGNPNAVQDLGSTDRPMPEIRLSLPNNDTSRPAC